MRKITTTTDVFKFSELSDDAKTKAVALLCDLSVGGEWWDGVYMDADTIGMKITAFDCERVSYVDADFDDVDETVKLIKENHGETRDTFKLASEYEKEYDALVTKYSDGKDTERVAEGSEHDFDADADELRDEFCDNLKNEYLSYLRDEYEYLTSAEAIIEVIELNDYEFTEGGELV